MDPIAIGEALSFAAAGLAALGLAFCDGGRLRLFILLAAAIGAFAALLLDGRITADRAMELVLIALGAFVAGATLGQLWAAWLDSARSVRPRNRPLRRAMGPISPRAFRRLMRLADRRFVSSPQRLTREGRAPEHLWYVAVGPLRVERDGEAVQVEGPLFVGELSFMIGAVAPATITALPGAQILEWDGKRLRSAFRRDPGLRTALEAVLGRDLARKVSSVRPAPDVRLYESVAPTLLAS